MARSAAKEREIAIKKNRIIMNLPYIIVIADGAWSKRTFGTAFDSLGGCAVVVGFETGEIIDIVVRNIPCAICDKAERESRTPKEHNCYSNYDRTKSSGAMESEAVAEAFSTSVDKYGLIYRFLIADGDSSVLARIQAQKPYHAYGVKVKKIECTNHLLRNFCNRLNEIGKTRDPNEIRGDGSVQARHIIKKSRLDLRNSVLTAVDRRTTDECLTHEELTSLLLKDILNIPSHVFGEHKGCLELGWSCNGQRASEEENLVPLLQSTGVYSKVCKIVRDLGAHADSLLYNVTNNAAECFNSIICKTISGKRVNYNMRGSYTGRCHGSVLHYTKKAYLSSLFKDLNKTVSHVVTDMESRRKLQVERNRQYGSSKRRTKAHRSEHRQRLRS